MAFTRTVEQKSFAFMHGADRDRTRVWWNIWGRCKKN